MPFAVHTNPSASATHALFLVPCYHSFSGLFYFLPPFTDILRHSQSRNLHQICGNVSEIFVAQLNQTIFFIRDARLKPPAAAAALHKEVPAESFSFYYS